MTYKLACEKKKKPTLEKKGTSHRRVMSSRKVGDVANGWPLREVQYHATKGYRIYRV